LSSSGSATDFRGWTCHAPEARIERLTAIVVDSVEPDRVSRVLDIGCGGGLQLRRLAQRLAAATLVGVDISAANIASAETARASDPAAARLSFVAADYLALDFAHRFDLVISDGVLHLFAVDDERLAAKLATDLAPDGTLVVSMAVDCLYNRAFAVARRALRAIRSPVTDSMILRAARVMHGDMTDDMLRERVPYMYTPPARLMGRAFIATLSRHGLHLIASHAMKSSSLSQLTHAAYVFRKVKQAAGPA
jgi:SAM-dependent methyltransferase